MSYKKIAEDGINLINKSSQHHQMPWIGLDYIDATKENTVYGVSFSVDRTQHIEFIRELSNRIPDTSIIHVKVDNDNFVQFNLEYEFKDNKKVSVEQGLVHDVDCGNPIFYERSDKAVKNVTGNKLAYDKYIKNSVENLSGNSDHRGPYVTDTTWFQGGSNQGTFRNWLLSPEFGLKNIIVLDASEFDVDSDKTELCLFTGEYGYTGDITVNNMITGECFTRDFRKSGIIIKTEKLVDILPQIQTKTKYFWKRSKVQIKVDRQGNLLKGPTENPTGKVPVVKRVWIGQEPEIYYTDASEINDWEDVDKWRFCTGYSSGGMHKQFYRILKGFIAPPGMIVPGGMYYTYVVVDEKTAEMHKQHLLSPEVQKILKYTRRGKSLHEPQTIWVPYATEFNGWTEEQKKVLDTIEID